MCVQWMRTWYSHSIQWWWLRAPKCVICVIYELNWEKIHRKKFNYNKEFLSTEMKYDNLSLCEFRQKTRSTRLNIQNIFPVCTKATFSFYLFSFFGKAIWNKFLYHVVFFKFVMNSMRCGGDDGGGSGFWPISYFIVVCNLFVSVCASFWKTKRCNT